MVVARTPQSRLDVVARRERDDKRAELRALVDEAIAERGPGADTRETLHEVAQLAAELGDHELAQVIDQALAELPAHRARDLASSDALAADIARETQRSEAATGHHAIEGTLRELARFLGTVPPESGEARLDHIFDLSSERAAQSAEWLAEIGRSFGLGDVRLVVDDEAAAKVGAEGAVGLFEDDTVYLDPHHYKGEGPDDRALLAHELAHAAQAERPGVGAALAPAEDEAYAIMEDARAGRALSAPEMALPSDAIAACGPIEMQKKEDEKKKGEKEDPKKEDPKKGGGGGGGPDKPQNPDDEKNEPGKTEDPKKEDPKKDGPKTTDDPKTDPKTEGPKEPQQEPEADAGECLDACAEPDAEHQQAEVKTPAPAKPGPGKIIKLNLAGHIIKIRLNENQAPGRVSIRFRASDSPYKALRLDSAVIDLDDELNVKAGAVKCGVKLGKYVQADNVSLAVRKGGYVAVSIKGAKVQVGSYVSGTVDLDISPRGIAGRARFTAEQIELGDGLVVKGGMLDVKVELSGAVSIHGQVTLEVPDLGSVTLDICFVDGELRGHMSFEWARPITIVSGVVLERVKLEGCYRKGSWSLTGEVELGLWDKLGATIRGTYYRVGQSSYWAFSGELEQRQPMEIGALTVDKGRVYAGWKKDTWEPATAHFEFAYEEMTGSIDGTYDLNQKKLDARGAAQLDKPLKLGKTGATIEEATLEAVVEQNELVMVHGAAKVTLPYQGKDTFKVEAEATWLVKEDLVDATGSVTVLRDVVFGQKSGMHATLKQDAVGQFEMKASEIVQLGGNLAFEVHHRKHEVGKGVVNFSGGNASSIDGEAQFALTNKTGIPDVKKGPLYLLEGGEFRLSIVKSALGKAEASNVKWELYHPKGTGKVTGEVAGHYDFDSGLATLSGSMLVEEPWLVADAKWGKAQLLAGGNGKVGVVDSKFTELEGSLPFEIDVNPIGKIPAFTVEGEINGKVDPKTWKVDGDFRVALKSPLEIPIGDKGDKIILQQGSELTGKMVKGDPSELGLDLTLDYHKGAEGLFLQGQVTDGKYDLKKGLLGFHASLTLKRPIEQKLGEKWKLRVEPEITNLTVDVAKNKLTKVSGDIQLSLYDGEAEPLLTGGLTNAVYDFEKAEPEFSGDLKLELARDVKWPRGDGSMPPMVAMNAKKGSNVSAKLSKNTLATADIDIKIDVELFSIKVGAAGLTGHWDLLKGKVSGDGFVKLTEDIAIGGPDAKAPADSQDVTEWALVFVKGSEVTIKMLDNKLEPATVSIDVALRRGEKNAAEGKVAGEYVFGDDKGFDGTIAFHLVEDIPLGKAGRFDAYLGKETKADGTIAKNALTDAKGVFVIAAKEGDKDALHLAIDTTYQGGKFSGQADLTVKSPVRLGDKTLGQHQYAIDLGLESQAKVTLTENQIGLVDGKLQLDVGMDGIPFARGTFQAAYDFSDPAAKVNAEGSLELFASVELGRAGMFTFFLDGGTNITGKIEDNALAFIEGGLVLGIATDREGRVGALELQGRYDGGDEPKFKGSAGAKITNKFLLGYSAFGYEFGFAPSNFDIMLEDGEITAASGNIVFVAEQFGGDDVAPLGSLTVTFSGTYEKPIGAAQGNFSGEGKCDVAGQLKVGKAGDYEFFVMGGTGIGITVESNEFTKLHGALKAEVHQLAPKKGEDKRFLGLDCEIDYVPKDGGKINCKGSCSMLGNKEVLAGTKYSFWLVKSDGGTGAWVEIVDNTLVAVGGRVSCAVYDGHKDPLIVAHADGTWDRASNEFSGSGDIKLGRDITFPEGAKTGPLVKFKKGSGGGGSVQKNKVEKLSGKLDCEIWDATGPLVSIDAKGEYDAVNNNVVHAEGKAKLLRHIVIGGSSEADALIVIEEASAGATIVNSKLVALDGNMKFKLPKLKMGGSLRGGWTNANGKDEYWGAATIDFDFMKEPGKGRKLEGDISGQFNRDGTWNIVGNAAYHLTPKITTSARVELDQTLNPKIDALFEVKDQPLIKGREIFSMNMTLFKLSAGILSGGVTAGASIGMDDLLFSTKIKVENWHPLGNGTKEQMPTFDAELGLKWGLNFKAKIAAYIMLGLDIYIASLGGGVEGAAELEVPVKFNPKGRVRGGPDGFWGELDIGLAIAAKLNLSATPFVKAGIFGYEWKKDWPFTTSIDLFEWKWGTKYTFGDKKAAPQSQPANNVIDRGGGTKSTYKQDAKSQAEPKLFPESRPAAPGAEVGAPRVDPANEAAEKKEEEKEGMPGGLGEKMDKYRPVIDGLQYLSQLAEMVVNILKYILMGPVGWCILLFKMWWYEDPSWDKLADLMEKTVQAMRDSWKIFKPEIKDFGTRHFLDSLLGEEPSLLDALFGADDAVRDEVDKGTHLELEPEGMAEFIQIMMDGCCGDDDEDRILEILRVAGRRNVIRQVVAHVGGGADQILWKLDWSQDTACREIFDKYGVSYD